MGKLATMSIFELWERTGVVSTSQLTISYRCGDEILDFLKENIYHRNLRSGLKQNISKRLLETFDFPLRSWPLAFFNCSGVELIDLNGSKLNLIEVANVIDLTLNLIDKKSANATEITILSFYYAQVMAIQEALLLQNGLENVVVSTVDSMQGRENDIIILSAVRAKQRQIQQATQLCDNSTLGFIADQRRLCVALSRARKGLFIIGDADHLRTSDSLWATLVDYYENYGMMIH
ncbi:MAG: hypothetical protein GY820_24085 [Gammaproteobacteria bacterium]|nr:hypothetical protein [Gammaproteobacteria bacterium]